MEARMILLALVNGFINFSALCQSFPYSTTPDWQSTPAGHIATGLGLADINGDGWKDIIVANGNDIQLQHLVVYYNAGDGTFSSMPDWQSDDTDYHGHLAVGDIDKDGWIDVAVSVYIGSSGFGDPGKVKVYYNTGGELEGTPSFVSYSFYTFSCSLGDADADGDLDLATTGGEPYNSIYDVGKIFYNRNGIFSPNPEWETSIAFGSLDVEFGDADNNGFQDLIFISEETPNYIYLADSNGIISTSPSWQSAEPTNYINSVDFGMIGEFKHPGIVMTGNNQLGGDGRVRLYTFAGGVPAASSAVWSSDPFGYGSGILLSDVNLDGLPDLIYGGWWLPVKIHLAQNSVFETIPAYTSSTNSVVEAIQVADLDRDGINVTSEQIIISGNDKSTFYLQKQLVENILSVQLNGKTVNQSFWCSVPNKNWISFNDNIKTGDVLIVEYEYSDDGDMVITNWDSNIGNYIFYYDESTGISANQPVPGDLSVQITPNPVSDKVTLILSHPFAGSTQIKITDLEGRQVIFLQRVHLNKGYNTCEIPVTGLPAGVYRVVVSAGNSREIRKLVKM
jgi:hypothetical protein